VKQQQTEFDIKSKQQQAEQEIKLKQRQAEMDTKLKTEQIGIERQRIDLALREFDVIKREMLLGICTTCSNTHNIVNNTSAPVVTNTLDFESIYSTHLSLKIFQISVSRLG
jgi:hypothetical protein